MSDSRCGHDGKTADPFTLLGLPASASVTDDDVRSAWRRVATATHPDRPDGGDSPRFAAASAAYTMLRTRSGRGEALADLADRADLAGRGVQPPAVRPPREASVARDFAPTAPRDAAAGVAVNAGPDAAPPAGLLARALSQAVSRVVHGRPAVLAARMLIVAAVGAASASLVGFAPATPALICGAVTWLVLTARRDLAPPGSS